MLKFWLIKRHFHSRKCILKWCLQTGCHFVSVSVLKHCTHIRDVKDITIEIQEYKSSCIVTKLIKSPCLKAVMQLLLHFSQSREFYVTYGFSSSKVPSSLLHHYLISFISSFFGKAQNANKSTIYKKHSINNTYDNTYIKNKIPQLKLNKDIPITQRYNRFSSGWKKRDLRYVWHYMLRVHTCEEYQQPFLG